MYYYYGWGPLWPYTERPMPLGDPSDVSQFQQSAKQSLTATSELVHLLNVISSNASFSLHLKKAASESNKPAVERLIQSLGIHTPFLVNVTPDGISIEFRSPGADICFKIRVALCW
ncbi:hypothetical protein D7M11_31650 [Paenibacillus ginsengarvi]|uniref:Uncharacterized protein n=1 Tax=Paenibacillus ginsengarvi TaxID=400777 RepID=A0A3B0B204_9BACL|nr:hypothetical protein D7M11_31650 [Paenibacillus ginsengarvi]